MQKQTFGGMVAELRKEQGMTQLELAEKMGVTDKAVSKWERDLSFPDVSSIPKLAEIFGISVDELMQVKAAARDGSASKKFNGIISLVLKGISLAMGIAVVALMSMNQLEINSAVGMLGLGLACLALTQFSSPNPGGDAFH